MKKVALYARVSTERQENEQTIRSQIAELKAYCKQQQYLITDCYSDDGYSGAMLARPALDRLRDDARQNRMEAVVIHAVDRLSRNHIHAGIVMEELQKLAIDLLFLNAPDTGTSEGRLLFDMQSVIAKYEREKIRERTRRGKLYKARSGRIVGHLPPYGYRYVKHKTGGTYEIAEAEAEIVRRIFSLYTGSLLSIRAISKELYQRHIPPLKGGDVWRTSSLKRLLSNETYAGTTHYNKYLSCEPRRRTKQGYKRRKNTSTRLRPRGVDRHSGATYR